MFSTRCPYLPLLFTYIVFLFSSSFSYSFHHETFYNFWFDFVTNSSNYWVHKKYFLFNDKRKNVTLIVTKPNDLIFWWYKVWVFLPLYELTSSLVFSQVTDQKSFLSYHILINILSMNTFLWQEIFKRYNVSYKVFSKLETFQNKKKQA